ncbi:hypothetical protein [Piscirickettsia salmonis]|nr:hypothetical protein [Piscirickettsia salmonis]
MLSTPWLAAVVRSSFDTAQKGQETIDLSDQLDHGRDEGYAL